eukprot:TRINITY_DN15518_c0_g1_i2.p1 TRINITY_DN15518_c0_g1~~TRINITY_DN15518_c0_g1_i2.p1  ORF type:complete len:503 (-),score=89.80 TRINITY_DN15518_c0_g1_i2:131-1639(-)
MPSGKKAPRSDGRAAMAAALSSWEAAETKMKDAGAQLLARLQEQVDKLTKMAEDSLKEGLLGHYDEFLQMRDKARQTHEDMCKKLGVDPPTKTDKGTRDQRANAAGSHAPVPQPAGGSGGEAASSTGTGNNGANHQTCASPGQGAEGGVAASFSMDSDTWHGAAGLSAEEMLPRYRWRASRHGSGEGGAVLEVCGLADASGTYDELEVDMAEGTVRLVWPHRSGSSTNDDHDYDDGKATRALTLPLGFLTDLSLCRVLRKRRAGRLTIEIPQVQAALAPELGLAAALVAAGAGVVDGFFAAGDADMVRGRLLELWRAGQFEPGEVEGGRKKAVRSDYYLYTEEDDPVLSGFTRRLDRLVLEVSRQVPVLAKYKLMRGRPMAAVYEGAGSRYTPHFDCVGNDNGRVLTCLLYLNPFWSEGDGAKLRIWPEARSLSPEGPNWDFSPMHGRLVAFLCNSRNLHEVLPVAADRPVEPRLAVSCWYYDSDRIPEIRLDEGPADAPSA